MTTLLLTALAVIVALLTGGLVHQARRPRRRTAAYAVARGFAVDPGDLGLAYDAWTIDGPGGVTIPVWHIDTGVDDPRTAVLVHGWGQSRIDSLVRIEPFRTRFGRVVLYDLRGHGEARGGPSRLGVDEHEDLLALLEHLDPERPVVLVGSSMGAVICVRAAATAEPALRDRIAGVVLIGVAADFHASLRGRLRQQGLPTRPISDLAMLWWRLRGLRHHGLDEDLSRVSCPVLLLHGEFDDVAPVEHAARLAEAAAHATLDVIPDARHLDLHLTAPEALDAALDRWLEPTPA